MIEPEVPADIVAFIRERLDEDEHDARTARPMAGHTDRWTWLRVDRPRVRFSGRVRDEPTWCVYTEERSEALVAETTDIQPRSVKHIARHDPRRVLRGVEAKRKLLDEHADNGGYRRAEDGALVRSGPVGDHCLTCVDDSSLIMGGVTEFTMMASWPCRTARLLASEWDTHEDYRSEWKP